jgi:hypothetical protein
MLVDGNDERGIDVGIMTKPGFPIGTSRSNVDTEDGDGIVFSRDCPEYHVRTQSGADVSVLVNHFKSHPEAEATDVCVRRERSGAPQPGSSRPTITSSSSETSMKDPQPKAARPPT